MANILSYTSDRDVYFTDKPQVTIFKSTFKRHTNFCVESIEQKLVPPPMFGHSSQCELKTEGHAVSQIFLKIILPEIKVNYLFAWVKHIGYAIIDKISVYMNGTLLDQHTGEYMYLLGDMAESPKMNQLKNHHEEYELFIPLNFWFNNHTGTPLSMANGEKISLRIQFAKFMDCCIYGPTQSAKVDNIIANIPIKGELINRETDTRIYYFNYNFMEKRIYYAKKVKDNIFGMYYYEEKLVNIIPQTERDENSIPSTPVLQAAFMVNYVILEQKEADKLNLKENIMERVEMYSSPVMTGRKFSKKLQLTGYCKMLLWVIKPDFFWDNPFNYLGILNSGKITLDDNIISAEYGEYYQSVEPWKRKMRTLVTGCYMQGFSEKPMEILPSGEIILDNKKLSIELNQTANNYRITIYILMRNFYS